MTLTLPPTRGSSGTTARRRVRANETQEELERRTRRRAVLIAVGALPLLLVLAFTVKVVLMLHGNATGRDAFDRGDDAGAVEAFAGTRSLNLLEPWVALFDGGAAWHGQGRYDRAVDDYVAALEVVPRREECTVRINLSLAHEAQGDAAAASGDDAGAREEWQRGVDALTEGRCPTDSGRGREQSEDAAGVEERLQRKLAQSQQQPSPQPQPAPAPQQQPGGTDPRSDQLERNNQRGLDQRQRERELYQDQDLSRPNSW